MTVIDHKNDYLERRYEPANEETRNKCGIYATCPTCRFCVCPTDYELTGFKSYCIHEIKE